MTVITVPTATRPILLPGERTEYGAKVVQTGTIYMHDFSTDVVQKFITEMSTVTTIRLVTREWVGSTHGAWKEEGK